jgi:hypothetical protein
VCSLISLSISQLSDLTASDMHTTDVASTSPPNSKGFVNCTSSNNPALNDYEVEVVEIRVTDDELDRIIP